MKKRQIFYLSLFVLLISSCSSNDRQKEIEADYQEASSTVERMNKLLQNSNHIFSEKEWKELQEEEESLSFDYDEEDVKDDETLQRYAHLQQQIKEVCEQVESLFDDGNRQMLLTRENVDGKLIEGDKVYPIYVKRGEVLFVDADLDNPVDIRVYNGDSHALLKSLRKKTTYHDTITIPFSAIYLVEVEPSVPTYVNLTLRVKTGDKESIKSPIEIVTESENVSKKTPHARAISGIQMKSLFEEPRKFTLRGQIKAAFSGSCRTLVPLQVPKGATDILYSLRISTNETPAESDGEFKQNMDLSYHKIRILGLPLYESRHGSGLLSTILGENVPPREEDAYINMYVFMNAKEARKFQNGAPTGQLKYHLDYSQMGTQSCDGRIPCAGRTTIYLAFENERMRYNNYVWLEAIASTPTTEYVREKYTIKQNKENDDEEEYEE